ncbi:ABC transporter permease [Helicobacter sp.]|uniref:ABC transporter permease n=1 Tax=Helicobacter sp. TaxID=218 RepID=UPI0025B91480|nr:ABC transporter permease [Helicobacter sp.]MBR2495153.1 ABC transporter permease [Helicobacter sp.]
MFLNAFTLAFKQIRRNLLRAFLTMLGVIIGVISVVVMIAIGNGVKQNIQTQIKNLGSNIIMLNPARGFGSGGGSLRRNFSSAEVAILKHNLAFARAVAPVVYSETLVRYGGKNAQVQISGVDEDYLLASAWELESGRTIETREYSTSARVCLVGQSVVKELFNQENPLGARVRIRDSICEIIGVLESKGQGFRGNDQDNVILMPLKTFSNFVFGTSTPFFISQVLISLDDGVDNVSSVAKLRQIMLQIRPPQEGQRELFEIWDTKEMAKAMEETTKTMTLFLGAIASVSLFVGGVGIMNIMLVSVTERTREIGTRLAIGALESEVLMQFLVESVVLSSLGGCIGIVLGFFGALFASYVMVLPFVFDIGVAFMAFCISVLIGIIFGYLPAKKASMQDPINALRYE